MSEFNYGAIRSAEEFEGFVDRIIAAGKPFGFDIESGYRGDVGKEKNVALKFRHPNWVMVGFSFTNSEEWARYVPIDHDTGDNVDDPVRVARALWRMLQSGLGVAHNALFELGGLARWFRDIIGDDPEVIADQGFYPILSDTMIEAFLTAEFNPQNPGQGLKPLTKFVFGHQMIEFDSLFEEMIKSKVIKASQKAFNLLPLTAKVITYACEDALWCLKHHKRNIERLKKMNVYRTVYKAEIALLRVVARMEYEGLMINWDTISRKKIELDTFREKMNEEIQQELSELLGRTININLGSVPQLKTILFDPEEGLGIEPKEMTDKGEPSTSEPALRSIVGEHPILKKILQYREVVKLLGSYLRKYEDELNYAGNGRAYPNHKQTGTTTGRFSVDGVSYQQWPKPYHYELKDGTLFDLNWRDLLVSPEGFRIIGYDYSQVELRVLAGVAHEKTMIEAFESGEDIHKATASKMLGIPVSEVTKEDRQLGKTMNFAIVYGSGASGLANLIGCSTEEAQVKMDQYFSAFSGIRSYMAEQVSNGHSKGYIENLFGRRITIWEFLDTRRWIVSKGERFCGNAPIQGGAGDYIKIAMVRADQAIRKAGLQDKVKLVITFHDALEWYVHESVTTEEFIALMDPAVSYPIPGFPLIKADWHEGYQWGSIAEIDVNEGKIGGYSIAVELPDRTKHSWKGDDLHSVLTPYYHWSREHYGKGYHDLDYYLSRVPDAEGYVSPQTVEEIPEVVVDSGPERVLITLTDMPSLDGWSKFKDLLEETPGSSEVSVVTPEGTITFDERYGINAKHQGKISMYLGGASVSFPESEEPTLEGIEL